ncbi:MAG: polysaccharide deacetylase family protein [Anaerolineaceae bacterium]|jgi:peptidoglycan/xylan/chitin deacetylase (PgdA/CDA1 family)|nr:polysaccharide deacetylase family protein [Anaerolineaceae bacterium]
MVSKKIFRVFLYLTLLFAIAFQPLQAVLAETEGSTIANVSSSAINLLLPTNTQDNSHPQEILPPKDPANIVYLTFDDGPDPEWTIQILNILERYQAGATFYMVGSNVVSYPEIVSEVASRGQTVAVHGFNHVDLSGVGYGYFYNEIHDTETAIMEALGEDQVLIQQFGRCMRPPYGKRSNLLEINAETMGFEVSMWNIDTKDWLGLSPEEILTHIRASLEPQKVILMHDAGLDRSNTIRALELILHELLMQGYTVLPYCTHEGQAIKTSD